MDLVDGLGPAVRADPLARVGLVRLPLGGVVVGVVGAPDHVAQLDQDVAGGSHRRPVVVARLGLRPLVGILGTVPEPPGRVLLLVQQGHATRPAEPDARALLALVVEFPVAGLIRHRAPWLEADAVPAADLRQRGRASLRDERLARLSVLLGVVELDVPIDAEDDR